MSRNGRSGAPSARRTRASGRQEESRAQSNVVGVAILLGVVVLSLGSLTAAVGTVVEENAATADATRVAADLDAALDPVEATGVDRGRISFTDGRLRTVERDLRVLNDSEVLRTVPVDALVFTAGDRRVAFLAGASSADRKGTRRCGTRHRLRPPVRAGPTASWSSARPN